MPVGAAHHLDPTVATLPLDLVVPSPCGLLLPAPSSMLPRREHPRPIVDTPLPLDPAAPRPSNEAAGQRG